MDTHMTYCTFLALGPDYVDILGDKSFENFAAARAFLRAIVDNNLDALEQINGYVAMLCAITQ